MPFFAVFVNNLAGTGSGVMEPSEVTRLIIVSVGCFVSGFLLGRETVIQKWRNWRDELHRWREVE